jgi:hypothetical protein
MKGIISEKCLELAQKLQVALNEYESKYQTTEDIIKRGLYQLADVNCDFVDDGLIEELRKATKQ